MGIFKLLLVLIIFLGSSFALLAFILKTTNSLFFPKTIEGTTLGTSTKPRTSNISANLTLNPPDNFLVTTVVILEVVDINTVRVLLPDGMQTVDLIGIKIPTDTSQARYEECFGETIETSIQNLALGKKAFMLDDNYYSEDTYKYIFLEDLTFLNQELIRRGITNAISSESYMYREEFESVRMEAENESQGVWDTECEKLPTPTVKQTKTTAKSTPTPTKVPFLYAKLISSPTPTKEPTPTPTEKLQSVQSMSSSAKPSSLNPEILFALINNHRQSIGKPAFEKDERLCSLARERGPELYDEIFVTHNVHAGLQQRNLPYWITENMAHYDTEEQVFNWWMGSTIHRRAIESDNKYSCGECYGNSCAQLFSSFIAK